MLIDPGHGGHDAGAVSGTTYEKNIVLAYAKDLGEIAKNDGRTVRYTRTDDRFIDVNKRGRMVKPGEILISCHTNAVGNPKPSGASVWYHKGSDESYDLAVEVFEHIMATRLFRQYNAGVICDTSRYLTGFAVLREAVKAKARAAILVEPGFLSNPNDRAKLTDPKSRILLAQAIYDGVCDYLRNSANK